MVALAICFDLGRYHATPWGEHVNEAGIEWPPSPWRLLRALAAVARTNTRLHSARAELDGALVALAQARPPLYELPPARQAHTRHFMPSRLFSASKPGATDLVLDAFNAVSPDEDLIVAWDVSLTDSQITALGAAASCLGYVGRSESVCSARLVTDTALGRTDACPVDSLDPTAQALGAHEVVGLLCPTGDDPLAAILTSVEQMRSARQVIPRGTRFVDYAVRSPEAPSPAPDEAPRPQLARYRLVGHSRPAIREAVAVGESLRAALQSRFGRQRGGEASPILSGRAGDDPRRDQHRHAHYLCTPDPDGRRVDHVTVWAPEGFGPAELEALAGLAELRIRGLPAPLRTVLVALASPREMRAPDLLGPSPTWRSLTPFGLTRHPKRRAGGVADSPADQIRRELALRGHPEPSAIELLRGPWLEFRRTRTRVSRREAPSAVGARVTFAEPVSGPLALGALSHFGLGLFVPDS